MQPISYASNWATKLGDSGQQPIRRGAGLAYKAFEVSIRAEEGMEEESQAEGE